MGMKPRHKPRSETLPGGILKVERAEGLLFGPYVVLSNATQEAGEVTLTLNEAKAIGAFATQLEADDA